jgi:hypothetical protein
MTWYLFIILGIAVTVLAYRKKSAISRLGVEQASWFERFFGTDFGMTCCACVTLGVVLGFIVKADPTISQLREMEESYERKQYHELGQRLGSHVKAKANGGKALVITRAPSDLNRAQHENLIEGIKAGLGNVQIGAVVFADFLREDKSPEEQALPYRLSNAFMNRVLQKNVNCSVVISTVGVSENFVDSNLAADVTIGKRAFALYSDNVYMQVQAMALSRRYPFDYCVFPNPGFDGKLSLAGKDFNFETHYAELSPKDKAQRAAVLKKHRRMFYFDKRQIVKEESKKNK